MWVTRGQLAAARMQLRARQVALIPHDSSPERGERDQGALATNDFAASWRAMRDQLIPGHARRAMVNGLVTDVCETQLARADGRQPHPMWAASRITGAEDCWKGYAGDYEVTWFNGPDAIAITFLTLTEQPGTAAN